MARLKAVRVVDPVLTTLARGYTNASFIGMDLFPVAEMTKEGGSIPVFGKEMFDIHNTERAIRAASNRISPEDPTSIDVVLKEHDLEYPIDYRESDEAVFDLESYAVDVVSEGMRLRHEKVCADLAQTTGSYAAGLAQVLSGTDQFDDAGSHPIELIKEMMSLVRTQIGRRPNTLWFGDTVFQKLGEHPDVVGKIKYVQKGVVTPDMLASLLEVEKVVVGQSIYRTQDKTMTDLWGNTFGGAFVTPGRNGRRSYRDPSFGYTLKKKGYPQVDTYDEGGGKLHLVRSTDIETVKIVGSDAGFLCTNVLGG